MTRSMSKCQHAPAKPDLAPLDDILKEQLNRGELRLAGLVSTSMAEEVAIQLRYLVLSKGKKDITIFLNSPGGSIYAGFCIYDTIVELRKHATITIHVSGMCMSMASIILQAGTTRTCSEHSAFMLHELSMENIGSLGELKDKHKEGLRLQSVIDGLISKRTGMSLKQVHNLVSRKDWYINAEEAVKYNLVDAIV